MSFIKKLQKNVSKVTEGYFANWTPDMPISVGDYGNVKGYRFTRDGNVSKYIEDIDPTGLLKIEGGETLAQLSDSRLCKLAEDELQAHAMRCECLGFTFLNNIPWAILIGAIHSESQSVELTVSEIASRENSSENLVLRWAKILAEEGLVSVLENPDGSFTTSLQGKGRTVVIDYLIRLNKESK